MLTNSHITNLESMTFQDYINAILAHQQSETHQNGHSGFDGSYGPECYTFRILVSGKADDDKADVENLRQDLLAMGLPLGNMGSGTSRVSSLADYGNGLYGFQFSGENRIETIYFDQNGKTWQESHEEKAYYIAGQGLVPPLVTTFNDKAIADIAPDTSMSLSLVLGGLQAASATGLSLYDEIEEADFPLSTLPTERWKEYMERFADQHFYPGAKIFVTEHFNNIQAARKKLGYN